MGFVQWYLVKEMSFGMKNMRYENKKASTKDAFIERYLNLIIMFSRRILLRQTHPMNHFHR